MDEQTTVIAGIVIPSDSPVFLSIVAVHVVIALTAVVNGVIAMLSQKGSSSMCFPERSTSGRCSAYSSLPRSSPS
jgi:hypothetical protein